MIDVTITGADDGVDPEDLVDLTADFPFVEWGVLMGSPDRFGTPRYPTLRWIDRLECACRGTPIRRALHLCGAASRVFQTGGTIFSGDGPEFDRYQINGWRSESRHALVGQDRPFELILQARDREHLAYCVSDAAILSRSSILFDASGGRGIPLADAWTPRQLRTRIELLAPSIRLGVAGGISPENVETVLDGLGSGVSTWIDMESGVRTDDRFDLRKVRDVLEKVAAWNAQIAKAS